MATARSAGFKTGLALAYETGTHDECGHHKRVWKPALRPHAYEISGPGSIPLPVYANSCRFQPDAEVHDPIQDKKSCSFDNRCVGRAGLPHQAADVEWTRYGNTRSGAAVVWEGDSSFRTTHWSLVLLAGHADSPESGAALETLRRAYRYPLCAVPDPQPISVPGAGTRMKRMPATGVRFLDREP